MKYSAFFVPAQINRKGNSFRVAGGFAAQLNGTAQLDASQKTGAIREMFREWQIKKVLVSLLRFLMERGITFDA